MSIELDVPDAEYRSRPAISYSGAKDLMVSPALFEWRLAHPRADSTDFDLGRSTEAQLLGVGDPITVMRDQDTGEPYTSWVPKAKALREQARARGETPLLLAQAEAVARMVAAVRSHPLAGKLLEAGDGRYASASAFWTDQATGTANRSRFDWLIIEGDDGRPEVVDLKTTTAVDRRSVIRVVNEYRYHWQDAQYTEALAAHGVEDVRFRFVFVDKNPPHFTRVFELDEDAKQTGARFMAGARRIYARCLETGLWPAYPPRTELIGLPYYSPSDPEDVLT